MSYSTLAISLYPEIQESRLASTEPGLSGIELKTKVFRVLRRLGDVPLSAPSTTHAEALAPRSAATVAGGTIDAPRAALQGPQIAARDWTAIRLSWWLERALRDYEKALLVLDPNMEGASAVRLASEIEALSLLPEDWDAHGAHKVSSRAILDAIRFAWQLAPAARYFEPYADPDGSVGLEGHTKDCDVYVSFSPRGDIAYVLKKGMAVHRGHGVDGPTLRLLLNDLL